MSDLSSSKQQLILDTGKELFWKFGFRRVSVEELCREAGISKMTFYKYFSNKMDLVKTMMDGILQSSMEKYRAIVDSNDPYPVKVTRMVELKREQIHTMSNEFFRDYVTTADPEMIKYLESLGQESTSLFIEDFRKAQKAGDIRKDLNLEFLMLVMQQLIDMTHEEQVLDLFDNAQDLVMQITNFLFYGILSRDANPNGSSENMGK